MYLFKSDFLTEICAEVLESFLSKNKFLDFFMGEKNNENISQVCLNTQSKKKENRKKTRYYKFSHSHDL